MTSIEPLPVVLEGNTVRLEPLTSGHLDALCEVGLAEELWQWTISQVRSREDLREYLESALSLAAAGQAVPFVIIERASGRAVGSTRFGNIDRPNRHLEIGWTWVAPAWQRSAVNTETKYLLLTHAFEDLGCLRVEFKTDSLNTQSRAALTRLGAVEEGTFRNHMVTASGRIRHSVWFSITREDWPEVKARLEGWLGQRFSALGSRRTASVRAALPDAGSTPLLYGDLASWYRLVDPPEDHRDEAASYQAALEGGASPRPETLLELGAGAGHNAFHLKRRFRCTLTDSSEPMQALSRELNPECEHVSGDMRTLRLGRTFDCVLVHDAVMYMTTEDDLIAAARTAFTHTRPGGAAVFAPDCVRESFRERAEVLAGDDGVRALCGLEWMWDPDPADETFITEYAFLLRDGDRMQVIHDRHVEGLFTTATWERVLASVGYEVETFARPLDEDGGYDEVFLCRRP